VNVVESFRARHEHEPDGVWSAPGRVNLVGEHTDYNGGLVLPFAIDKRTWCAAGKNADGVVRVTSGSRPEAFALPLADMRPGAFPEWSGYALGVAWALREAGHVGDDAPGIDLHLDSDVPMGAGLSSSGALESAVAVALNDLWELGLSSMDLAQAGRRAENGAVGAPTGIMDQVASLMGVRDHAVLLDCATLATRTVPLRLAEQDVAVLILDSRVTHRHVDGGYGERRQACERAAAELGVGALCEASLDDLENAAGRLDAVTARRARHVLSENARVREAVTVLAHEGPLALGPVLAASHASLRDDFQVSVPEIDLMVEVAVRAGAIGARLTGGGFGGSAIALVESERAKVVADAVMAASTAAGFAEPAVTPVEPSDGAARHEWASVPSGGAS
jgi:galactokinase